MSRALAPLVQTVMSSGLDIVFSAYSVPGKIVISESLGALIQIGNERSFGILDTKELPLEVVNRIVRITVGYIASDLTDSYFKNLIAEELAKNSVTKVIQYFADREDATISLAKGTNQGGRSEDAGFPVVTSKVALVYSPFTHYVTLSVRSSGSLCPEEAVFLLRYEIDADGNPMRPTLKTDRLAINP